MSWWIKSFAKWNWCLDELNVLLNETVDGIIIQSMKLMVHYRLWQLAKARVKIREVGNKSKGLE